MQREQYGARSNPQKTVKVPWGWMWPTQRSSAASSLFNILRCGRVSRLWKRHLSHGRANECAESWETRAPLQKTHRVMNSRDWTPFKHNFIWHLQRRAHLTWFLNALLVDSSTGFEKKPFYPLWNYHVIMHTMSTIVSSTQCPVYSSRWERKRELSQVKQNVRRTFKSHKH